MLFNSLDFAIFLPIVFFFYWIFRESFKFQNIILLIASYTFYGWWDWRFLCLILLSTLVDYTIGNFLFKQEKIRYRKWLLNLSIGTNLGILALFKYFNFFLDSFSAAFSLFGTNFESFTLDIILPVGISFYTFQTLSYTIDIYRGNLKPAKNFLSFATFVSFFPQLVAGPIERAVNLLPQFERKRNFKYKEGVEGLRQILWGLFKKMVIADNCAEYVNIVFSHPQEFTGSTLLLGAILFAIQIYGDFSGYSDIAIGAARLFGIKLMQNFAYPYFSRNMAEFWRRWHISLSTWFRDYLYFPIGGSKGRITQRVRNIFVIFLISGLWHGANWTFVVWGGLNALFYIPLLIIKHNRRYLDTIGEDGKPSIREIAGMIITFILTTFAWIFFRSSGLFDAISYIKSIFQADLFSIPSLDTLMSTKLLGILILSMLVLEWGSRTKTFALERFEEKFPTITRWLIYTLIIFCIGMYMFTEETPFIYFKF